MTYKVGPKGQVVLPKALRDELGIEPGDDVDVERRDGEIIVRRATANGIGTELRGLLHDPERPGSLLAEFEAERRAERAREDAKDARFDARPR